MTQQDARERAWQTFTRDVRLDHTPTEKEAVFYGWDAAKRDDEQRIAALVEAARQVVHDYFGGIPMLRVSITELRRALRAVKRAR